MIDTSGAYIPGHGTPTVILFGQNRRPIASTIRTVMGIRGEPSTPNVPAKGLVWSAVLSQVDWPGAQSEFVSVADSLRESFYRHPWSIGGGGAAELKETIDSLAISTLEDHVDSIGPPSFAGVDDMFFSTQNALRARNIEYQFVKPLCNGDIVRNWISIPDIYCIVPYNANQELISFDEHSQWGRYVWLTRRSSEGMLSFNRKTRKDLGEPWWSWYRWIPQRFKIPLSIAFAFVATHNHFVLDRGGKVFKQTAPVIKLPPNATEDDHLALLGLLNSSTACFWGRQTLFPRGGFAAGKWEERLEWDGTKLLQFPLPTDFPLELARQLDEL